MSRSVLLHAADLHLDAPFEGVGRVPAPIAAALRDASVDVWDALVDLALTRDVVAVLLAGGVCAGLERGARAQARLRDGVSRLSAAGVAVFLALGDDDPSDGFAAIPAWPPSVTVFPPGRPTAVPLQRDGRRIATIHGMSAARQPSTGDALAGWARGDAPGPHLAVLHASLAGHASDDGTCRARYRIADLRPAQMDYWALGHAAAEDRLAAAPWIVYPGTPQGRSLAPAQCGAKGAVLIAIEDGVVAGVDFEPVDRIRCLRVPIDGVDDPAALAPTLSARADELRRRHPGRGLLLDACVAGAPAVGRLLRQPAARTELLRALRAAAADADPFVWWVAVRPAPRPKSAGAELTDGDLADEAHRRRAALGGDATRCASFVARQFAPLQALWAADADARETAELLDGAAELAADALREDGT